MKTIFEALTYQDIISRINRLEPSSTPLWGKMTPNQMICHVSDGLRDFMGMRIMEPMLPPEIQQQLKAIVFGADEWEHSLPTLAPYSQEEGGMGTKPVNLKDDRDTLLELLNQFYHTPPDFHVNPHPGLNMLSREESGIYIWRHADYHLRQFGI